MTLTDLKSQIDAEVDRHVPNRRALSGLHYGHDSTFQYQLMLRDGSVGSAVVYGDDAEAISKAAYSAVTHAN